MNTSIIRCLFGNPFGNIYWSLPRLNGKPNPLGKDITEDKRKVWELEEIDYFVMGIENAECMKKMGAKKIHLVSKKSTLTPNELINPLYNKVFLINEAMKMYSEILYLDFDIISHKDPDYNMWESLRKPTNKFGSSIFKAPVVQKRFNCLLDKKHNGFRDGGKDCLNILVNTCLVYCNDKTWVESWLDHFLLYQKNIGTDITKHDEHIFMYFLDKEKGVMNTQELVEVFDTEIVRTHKEIVHKPWDISLYFRHKKK